MAEEQKPNETASESGEPKTMTKTEFLIRFALWIGLALIAPFIYLSASYGLFVVKEHTKTLSGWGILAIIFVAIVMIGIIRNARKALPVGNMLRQCIDGVISLIPLLAMLLIIHSIKGSIDDFEKFLIFTILCEAVAIPVNPMPKWGMQQRIDIAGNTIVGALKSFFTKKK